MTSGPRWTRRRGRAVKASVFALSLCFRSEMSSMSPIMEAMKNTLIAARKGGSATFPRSFWSPTTRLREIEKAKRAAMPPSSATVVREGLFTSSPTIPPALILRMRGGVSRRTRTRERARAIRAPKPSDRSIGGQTRNGVSLPPLDALVSTVAKPVKSIYQGASVVLAPDTCPRQATAGQEAFIARNRWGDDSHADPDSPDRRGLARGPDRRWHLDLALGPGPGGGAHRAGLRDRQGRLRGHRRRPRGPLQGPELRDPVQGPDDRGPRVHRPPRLLHERCVPAGRKPRRGKRPDEGRGRRLGRGERDGPPRPHDRPQRDGRGRGRRHEGRPPSRPRRRRAREDRGLGVRLRAAPGPPDVLRPLQEDRRRGPEAPHGPGKKLAPNLHSPLPPSRPG